MATDRSFWKSNWVAELGALLTALLLFGALAYGVYQLYLWDNTVERTIDAGTAQDMTYSNPTIGAATSRVTSSDATMVVRGSFPLIKGNPLVIEVRGDGDRYLCDRRLEQCSPLIE